MQIIEVTLTRDKFPVVKKGCVLTIGNFDGVHLGHQQILAAARQLTLQKSTELVAMTFDPHPISALYPQRVPAVLTPLALKKRLLAKAGVDYLLILKSTTELLSLSPADFVERFLVKSTQPSVVVEGENFNFGAGRSGSVHTLCNLGDENGFEVVVVETKAVKLSIGQAVKLSSSMIRSLLLSGKVEDAAIALSRPFRVMGTVILGKGKGKQIGFPTANMAQPNQLIPAEGVYAGFVQIASSIEQLCTDNQKQPAVFSIGRAETFGNQRPLLIEAHILTENVGNLIGKWMAMDFMKTIRDQRRFATETELAQEIENDCKIAKQILAKGK